LNKNKKKSLNRNHPIENSTCDGKNCEYAKPRYKKRGRQGKKGADERCRDSRQVKCEKNMAEEKEALCNAGRKERKGRKREKRKTNKEEIKLCWVAKRFPHFIDFFPLLHPLPPFFYTSPPFFSLIYQEEKIKGRKRGMKDEGGKKN
jgi:hypothetical protein